MSKIQTELLNWYSTSSAQGLSSKALANAAVNKVTHKNIDYPHDNSDFRRCYLFKKDCPLAFETAKDNIISFGHPIWESYFSQWDYMVKLLEKQIIGDTDGKVLFNLMQDIKNKKY